MAEPSILGHIVSRRLSRSYEDVATQALVYILRSSDPARAAMTRLVSAACPGIETKLRFVLQDAKDGARPDLAGVAQDEQRVLLIENKFWAGLTAKQPVGYLDLLPEGDRASLLLFVAPGVRADTLWEEITRRISDAKRTLERRGDFVGQIQGSRRRVALVTWTRVLDTLEAAVASDPRALADLRQLRGLCHAAEDGAFVPLSREELTDQRIPVRMINYAELVLAVMRRATSSGVVSRKGLRPSHGWRWTGRYFRFGSDNGVGAWIGLHLPMWRKHGRSPIWIDWAPGSFGHAGRVHERLAGWAKERHMLLVADGDRVLLAIDLRAGREREEVIDGAVAVLAELRDRLASLTTDPGDKPSLDDDDDDDSDEAS